MNIARYRKFIVALATALGILAVVLNDGVTGAEWIQVALAFLGSLGVYQIPNDKEIN